MYAVFVHPQGKVYNSLQYFRMIVRVLKASIRHKYFPDETNFKLLLLTLLLCKIPDLINEKTKLYTPPTYDLYRYLTGITNYFPN